MQPTQREPKKFCLGCGYVLDFITANQCPECGRGFDPASPATYRGQTRGAPIAKLIAAYLMPLALGVLFWTVIGAAKWHRSGNWPPLSSRFLGAIFQSTGPLAWILPPMGLWVAVAIVALLWVAWLLIVIQTRLSQLPVFVHLILAFLWCFMGCVRVSIWV